MDSPSILIVVWGCTTLASNTHGLDKPSPNYQHKQRFLSL